MSTDKITTLIETHTNNIVMLGDQLNDLIKDHQRLAKDSTHELANGIQLYMRVITSLQKTMLSFENVKKEMVTPKEEQST